MRFQKALSLTFLPFIESHHSLKIRQRLNRSLFPFKLHRSEILVVREKVWPIRLIQICIPQCLIHLREERPIIARPIAALSQGLGHITRENASERRGGRHLLQNPQGTGLQRRVRTGREEGIIQHHPLCERRSEKKQAGKKPMSTFERERERERENAASGFISVHWRLL